MIVFNFLRALSDLGLYYSVAGILSAAAGGRLVLAGLLLQSGCFALSSALRQRRVLRIAALLPSLLLFLPAAAPADAVACTPPLLYLAWLAWTDNYQLSWTRQVDIFNIFWRMFPVAASLLSLVGLLEPLLSAGVPAALITAAASVLLLRSLRHTPAVYLQPRYQTINFAGIALMAGAALALGSEWVVQTAVFLISTVYNYVFAPLLVGVAMAVGFVLIQCALPLQWLLVHMNILNGVQNENTEPMGGPLEHLQELNPYEPNELVHRILIALAVLAGAVVLFLLFRWMSRRREEETSAGTPGPIRYTIPNVPERKADQDANRYARRIRRQYRAFLRLCRERGVQLRLSDTSTDIGRRALPAFPDEKALAALRDLYQEARYHGASSREDCQRFEQLLGRLKQQI